MQRLWIPGKLPGLNQLLGKHHHAYNRTKRALAEEIHLLARAQGFRALEKAHFLFVHHERARNRDPDNFCGGVQKIVLDALVEAKLLPQDGWKNVLSLSHSWLLDPKKPGIEVFADQDVKP